MGNSCSSGQGHKDKDNMSQRSEESGSYQIRASLPSDKQQVLMNHVTHTGGVLLEPSTAGQQAIQQISNATTPSTGNEKKVPSKILRGIAAPSVSDSLSLSSPPGIVSPRDLIIDGNVPPELASLSEQLQNLLMGKVSFAKTASKTRKIVIYVCAADSQDCCVEKGALHNALYPELRARCRLKGYELHIVDLHWKTLLEKQQDHEFPELCIGELTRQMEVAYVIPVLFLNNSLGTPLLPISIECSDFQMAMNSVEDQSAQSLLSKWYKLDEAAQPPCYRLQSTSSHIPGFKETSTEDREKALEEWQSEIERMLVVLINVFSQELRDTYLTTVVEQEVHNTVFMSQELAKRCIWINRVYTPGEKTTNEPPSSGESEHFRRLNILQRDLRNQLAEKHIVRLPVKYVDGGLNMEIPEHAQYISQVLGHMNKHLTEMIDAIIDEHQSKNILKPSYGIDTSIFEELNQQTTFCQKAAQCSVNREKTISDIKNYILTENHSPLVIYGPGGCGKTTLLARIAQCTSQWLPESFLVLRFVGISAQSSTIEQLLSSITHQCSILTYGHKSSVAHTIDNYKNALPNLLMASCMQRPLIVVLDGIEQVKMYSSKVIDWLPLQLPDNIKLIISVSENSDIYKDMVKVIPEESFIRMPVLGELEAKGILMSSVMQYNHSVNSKIQDCVLKSVQECTLPLYTKVLAWQTSWWADKENVIVPKGQVDDQLTLMLEELETILGQNQVEHALAIMTSTKHGITDSEMLDLLAHDEIFQNNTTYVSWAPACLAWSRLNKHLAPFLQWTLTGTVLGVQWRDNMLLQAVKKRYKSYSNWAHEMLFNYYNGKWWSEQPQANLSARLISQDTLLGTCYNRRKLDELPYHYYYLHGSEKLSSSDYLNDLNWIYDKVCGSNCFQLLEDIHLCKQEGISLNESVAVLQSFLETYVNVLNYDGRQFYSQFYSFLSMLQPKGEDICSDIFSICKDPPIPSLIPNYCLDIAVEDEHATKRRKAYDLIVRLPETHQFVACISTEDEQISVWNAARWERVRLLKGIPHPTNLVPINQHKCIVLCQRELRIYDLNTGTFLTKLKGVMNQKMPYYGLHDASHLVALSRNRMYVNLMNLETGDCVTTFKAGEDRFLNSLLVSGDGRVLVCGDETQKPFPLLVWNLQSRKLLYDLRIPHHDFITSLSAITYEGNYVCCVCHEIDEPNPNFIVVYDLQSGTLFKKWKPSCDTVSLEISSQGGCVISGLEDARILVWDLITGNCRWTLEGHTAPVNYLRLEPRGVLFLSTDIQGRDKSIRVWDLNKGNLVAVYTTSLNITTCDMSLQGQTIILSMEGCEELVFLKLRGPGVEETIEELEVPYGDPEIDFAEFDLSESGAC